MSLILLTDVSALPWHIQEPKSSLPFYVCADRSRFVSWREPVGSEARLPNSSSGVEKIGTVTVPIQVPSSSGKMSETQVTLTNVRYVPIHDHNVLTTKYLHMGAMKGKNDSNIRRIGLLNFEGGISTVLVMKNND